MPSFASETGKVLPSKAPQTSQVRPSRVARNLYSVMPSSSYAAFSAALCTRFVSVRISRIELYIPDCIASASWRAIACGPAPVIIPRATIPYALLASADVFCQIRSEKFAPFHRSFTMVFTAPFGRAENSKPNPVPICVSYMLR